MTETAAVVGGTAPPYRIRCKSPAAAAPTATATSHQGGRCVVEDCVVGGGSGQPYWGAAVGGIVPPLHSRYEALVAGAQRRRRLRSGKRYNRSSTGCGGRWRRRPAVPLLPSPPSLAAAASNSLINGCGDCGAGKRGDRKGSVLSARWLRRRRRSVVLLRPTVSAAKR